MENNKGFYVYIGFDIGFDMDAYDSPYINSYVISYMIRYPTSYCKSRGIDVARVTSIHIINHFKIYIESFTFFHPISELVHLEKKTK